MIFTIGGGSSTVTRTRASAVPQPFVAVILYPLVLAGETSRVPDGSTEPMPLLIDTLSAFFDSQLSVELMPRIIVLGDAEMLTVGATQGVTVTVTVSLATRGPSLLFALILYNVVSIGDTERVPDGSTEPMP